MSRKLWIISEGSPGHISQSQGLAEALAQHVDLEIFTIETRPKLGGVSRWFLRRAMGKYGKPVSERVLRHKLHCELPQDNTTPDLILCSGGKSVFAARTLAARYEVPLIFIGERKPYPASWFTATLTPSPFEKAGNDIPVNRLPVNITPDAAHAAAANWPHRPQGEAWLMIIGGKSSSHQFDAEDWKELALGMNHLARAHSIKWLITTSRRTGAQAEEILRSHLDPDPISYAVWWDEKPEKVLKPMLGSASRVFVTQDSMTMITEALAVRKPTVLIRPKLTRFSKTSFLPGYLERLGSSGGVQRCETSTLKDIPPPVSASSSALDSQDDYAKILLDLLNWEPTTHVRS